MKHYFLSLKCEEPFISEEEESFEIDLNDQAQLAEKQFVLEPLRRIRF